MWCQGLELFVRYLYIHNYLKLFILGIDSLNIWYSYDMNEFKNYY